MSTHAKRGRKRLTDRERYSCGQVKPAAATSTAEWQRLRSIAKNPLLGSHLGRMGFLGTLDAVEVATGEKIGRIYGEFDRALGTRRYARSPGYEIGRGRSPDSEETEDQRERTTSAIRRMTHYEAEVEALSGLIYRGLRRELELLCVQDELPNAGVMPLVRRALAALAGPLGVRAAMTVQRSDNRQRDRS